MHDAGGYGTSSAWLAAVTQRKPSDAKAAQTRILARHPRLAQAMAAGTIPPSWVSQFDRLTRKLPVERWPNSPKRTRPRRWVRRWRT